MEENLQSMPDDQIEAGFSHQVDYPNYEDVSREDAEGRLAALEGRIDSIPDEGRKRLLMGSLTSMRGRFATLGSEAEAWTGMRSNFMADFDQLEESLEAEDATAHTQDKEI